MRSFLINNSHIVREDNSLEASKLFKASFCMSTETGVAYPEVNSCIEVVDERGDEFFKIQGYKILDPEKA